LNFTAKFKILHKVEDQNPQNRDADDPPTAIDLGRFNFGKSIPDVHTNQPLLMRPI